MRRILVAFLAVLLAAGCASGSKSGGAVTHEIRIVMQTPDAGVETDSKYFIAQVQKLTGGSVQIVEGNDYSSADPNNEARLVRALRSGKVEMAYIPSRSWERASSVTAFRALQAPLLVTNYRLLGRITGGPIGRSMLASLRSIGVVGLGLVPDELRRPLGRRPLDSPASFRAARIRVVTSPTSVLALRSLGALPLTNFTAGQLGPALRHARLDGAEVSTSAVLDNGYIREAHYLTANLPLFAKTQTIAIRASVLKRLSPSEQTALRAAAAATVANARPAKQELSEEKQLCDAGLALRRTSKADLASLEKMARPAYTTLERDPETGKEITAIQRLKAQAGGTSTLPPCPAKNASGPGSTSATLSGTYVMTASMSEITKAGGNRGTVDNWGAFRLILHAGRFRMSDQRPASGPVQSSVTCRSPAGKVCSSGWSAGTYAIQGDRITFTDTGAAGDTPIGAPGDAPIVCRWSLYRGSLTFRRLPAAAQAKASSRGLDPGGPPLLYVKPWQKTSN